MLQIPIVRIGIFIILLCSGIIFYSDIGMAPEGCDAKIDPALVQSIIAIESGGNPNAISHQGAVGLMQIMPRDGKAKELFGNQFAGRPTTKQLLDPEFNVCYGSKMLERLTARYGLRDGLKAYGPSGVGYTYADLVLAVYEN